MQNKPKVAVLLAAYNGSKFLAEQVNSILCQVDVDVHIFFSIDLSSDATFDLCLNIARLNKNVHLLDYGDRYGGAASNFYRLLREVDFSSFDYVSLSDQDDVWFSDKLSRACSVLKSQNLMAYSSNVIAFWSNGKRKLINKSQPQREFDYLFESAGPGCTYVFSCSFAMHLKNFLVSCWDEVLTVRLHDWFIYAFARANGYRWYIDDWASMLYRQHESNQIGVNVGYKAFTYRLYDVLNGNSFQQCVKISNLVGVEKFNLSAITYNFDRMGFFLLSLKARQCRRRWLDQLFFFTICIIFAVFPASKFLHKFR